MNISIFGTPMEHVDFDEPWIQYLVKEIRDQFFVDGPLPENRVETELQFTPSFTAIVWGCNEQLSIQMLEITHLNQFIVN